MLISIYITSSSKPMRQLLVRCQCCDTYLQQTSHNNTNQRQQLDERRGDSRRDASRSYDAGTIKLTAAGSEGKGKGRKSTLGMSLYFYFFVFFIKCCTRRRCVRNEKKKTTKATPVRLTQRDKLA